MPACSTCCPAPDSSVLPTRQIRSCGPSSRRPTTIDTFSDHQRAAASGAARSRRHCHADRLALRHRSGLRRRRRARVHREAVVPAPGGCRAAARRTAAGATRRHGRLHDAVPRNLSQGQGPARPGGAWAACRCCARRCTSRNCFARARAGATTRPSSGGGVLMTQNSHLIDMLLWMFGRVDLVSAHTSQLYSRAVEDHAHVFFQFASGLRGFLDASWSARHYRTPTMAIHVQGEAGTLDVNDDRVALFLSGTPRHGCRLARMAQARPVSAACRSTSAVRTTRCRRCSSSTPSAAPARSSPTSQSALEVQKVISAAYESATRAGRAGRAGDAVVSAPGSRLRRSCSGTTRSSAWTTCRPNAAASARRTSADPTRVLEVIEAAHARRRRRHDDVDARARRAHLRPDRAVRAACATRSASIRCLPYAQKYVTRSNEVGMVNVVLEMLSGTSLMGKLNLLWQGSKAALTKDVNAVLAAVMQVELKPFRRLNTHAVFLHDAFTDLALALGLRDVFEFYLTEMPKIAGVPRARLPPRICRTSSRPSRGWGLPRPLVMTHFNKAGYHMNPDRGQCEQAVAAHPVSVLAMGSLASGYLEARRGLCLSGGSAQHRRGRRRRVATIPHRRDLRRHQEAHGPQLTRRRHRSRVCDRNRRMCGIAGYLGRSIPGSTPAHDRRHPPSRAGRRRRVRRRSASPRTHAAGDHRSRRRRPADALGRRPVRHRLQRRDLQLRRAAGRPRGTRRPVPDPVRHRSHPARLSSSSARTSSRG